MASEFWRKIKRKRHIKERNVSLRPHREQIFRFITKREGVWTEEEYDVWVLDCGHERKIDSSNIHKPNKIRCFECEMAKEGI